ncbi:MAG TPA: DHH family phosphoesterase [Candidatus Pacearchaeota archaeon]|nr:DHH family phosphoesterase [Candidatus Parcubacteria bacterium]HOU45610.1 DHH family phosphoesterase [Candidatus Pacearchaeota archaeon]HQI74233.1 DHH family phosphoesterase [Candidatus Pacearchaeota archaeon]
MSDLKLKNFDNVISQIKRCAKEGGKVVIYSDSDMDGIVSALIMAEIFRYLNDCYLNPEFLKFYFPCRETEKYGLNDEALDYLCGFAPALLFTLDCGISNFDEIVRAKKMGFQVIVIDHHQILGRLPDALYVIDPHQEGEEYPFHDFANAGLMVKLAEEIVKDEKRLNELLAFGALATIADRVPQIGENKEITEKGLAWLKDIDRLGFRTLLRHTEPDLSSLDDISLKIINPLNVSARIGKVSQTFILLDSKDPAECEEIVKNLLEINKRKFEEKIKIVNDVVSRIEKYKKFPPDFIFEGSTEWDPVSIGSAASDILKKYGRPVFLFKVRENDSIGSARLPKEYNGVKALEFSKDYLIGYGGHPPACGYTFRNRDVNLVKESLEKYFRKIYE